MVSGECLDDVVVVVSGEEFDVDVEGFFKIGFKRFVMSNMIFFVFVG